MDKDLFKSIIRQLKATSLTFTKTDGTPWHTGEFCDALHQYDPELADKVEAWKMAEIEVHRHIERRLG